MKYRMYIFEAFAWLLFKDEIRREQTVISSCCFSLTPRCQHQSEERCGDLSFRMDLSFLPSLMLPPALAARFCEHQSSEIFKTARSESLRCFSSDLLWKFLFFDVSTSSKILWFPLPLIKLLIEQLLLCQSLKLTSVIRYCLFVILKF